MWLLKGHSKNLVPPLPQQRHGDVFEKVSDSTTTSGIGKPKMSLLGGQALNSNTRDVLVILLTPEILESPMTPENRMRDF